MDSPTQPPPAPANPHDALFHFVFSRPEHAAAELRHVLPPALVAAVDWSTLQVCDSSFRSPALAAVHADQLYSVRLAGREALVYVLCEHKSTSDRFTPFQLLVYVVHVWQRWREHHPKAAKLPPIIPVVLHHSEPGWESATCLHDLVDLVDLDPALRDVLVPFVPQFRFLLDDLARASAEELQSRAMSALGRLALFCLQRARHSGDFIGEMERWWDAARAVTAASDHDSLAAVFWYVLRVSTVDPIEFRARIAIELGQVGEEAFMTAADRLTKEVRERAFAQGRSEGRNEGRAEGRSEGRREGRTEGRSEGLAEGLARGRAELLIKQLTARFGSLSEGDLQLLRAANLDQLDTWGERVLVAPTLAAVLAER